jgi:four helix bundle protein
MGKIASFKDLIVWQKGHLLVLSTYRASRSFPQGEQFGLTSQIRRAVVSITSNIAEGFSRQTIKDKSNFYFIALGSCAEVQSQLLIAKDLGYLEENEYTKIELQTVEIHKMLNALIKSLKEK